MFSDDLKRLWGFHPQQDAFYNSYLESNPRLVPARVLFTSHEYYRVLILGTDNERGAKVRGHFYHEERELPVVGDWVTIELEPGDHEFLPIEDVLPRKSLLSRPDSSRGEQVMAANLDVVALVTSFNDDFNLRRLERGVAMIEDGRARPLLVVNKSDLVAADHEGLLSELRVRFPHLTVISCSAQTGQGMSEVVAQFAVGQTIAFLGMSGVGKSTLINAVTGEDRFATSAIREDDARGRHTTTHRELAKTKHGFWLLDSPGIREFAVADEEGIDRSFHDIASLSEQCRFGDCAHDSEPGCAIQSAIEAGELFEDRWQNYLKMRREAEFHARKHDPAFHSARRKEWSKRSMQLRQVLKGKGKK